MRKAARLRANPGLLLAALGLAGAVVLAQLARHPEIFAMFGTFPGPEGLVCNIRCLGAGPFLEVLGEAGRAALLVVFSSSFLYALARTGRRIVRTVKFTESVERRIRLRGPSGGAALPTRVAIFEDSRPLAFTAGFLAPRIYISTALVAALDTKELEVVLRHEERHRRRRDPFRSLASSFVADFLFFLPAGRALKKARDLEAEIAADDHAAGRRSDRLDLASSLLKVRGLDGAVVAGFADPTAVRLGRLLDESPGPRLPWRKVLPAVVLLAAAGFAALIPAKKGLTAAFLNHDRTCVLNTARHGGTAPNRAAETNEPGRRPVPEHPSVR